MLTIISSGPPVFHAYLNGQCRSGKNDVKTTQAGIRYPSKRFKDWRTEMFAQLADSDAIPDKPIDHAVVMVATYWAGDYRTRDLPGLQDAILHVLERAGVIKNDALVRNAHWITEGVSRDTPTVSIMLYKLDPDPLAPAPPKPRSRSRSTGRRQTRKSR